MCKSDRCNSYTLVEADSVAALDLPLFRMEILTLGLLVVGFRVISRVLLSIPYGKPSVRSSVFNFARPVSFHTSLAQRKPGDPLSREVAGNSSQDAGV